MNRFLDRITRNTADAAGGGGDAAGAAAADAAGADAAAAAAAGGAATAQPWIEAIPESERNVLIQNGFHKTRGEDGVAVDATPEQALAKAAKAYREAASKLGAKPGDLIPAPKDGEDMAVWLKTHGARLGVPETADKYQIERPTLPENIPYDETFEREALSELHAAGASNAVAQKAVTLFAAEIAKKVAAADAEIAGKLEAMNTELAKDWGPQMEARKERAARAFQHLAAQAGMPAEETGGLAAKLGPLLGDARVLKMFDAAAAAIGDQRMPGARAAGATDFAQNTPSEARARLAQIKAPGDGDYAKAERAGDARRMTELRAEIGRLSKIIAPPKADR